jgi:hypothetical protein
LLEALLLLRAKNPEECDKKNFSQQNSYRPGEAFTIGEGAAYEGGFSLFGF